MWERHGISACRPRSFAGPALAGLLEHVLQHADHGVVLTVVVEVVLLERLEVIVHHLAVFVVGRSERQAVAAHDEKIVQALDRIEYRSISSSGLVVVAPRAGGELARLTNCEAFFMLHFASVLDVDHHGVSILEAPEELVQHAYTSD